MSGNAILLATLIVLLVFLPFVPGDETQSVVSRIVWTVVIAAGIFRASGRRWFLWAALVIAVPSLLSNWVDIFGLGEVGPLVVALFFALISAQILADPSRCVGIVSLHISVGFDKREGKVNCDRSDCSFCRI